jgi:hypothetical protein
MDLLPVATPAIAHPDRPGNPNPLEWMWAGADLQQCRPANSMADPHQICHKESRWPLPISRRALRLAHLHTSKRASRLACHTVSCRSSTFSATRSPFRYAPQCRCGTVLLLPSLIPLINKVYRHPGFTFYRLVYVDLYPFLLARHAMALTLPKLRLSLCPRFCHLTPNGPGLIRLTQPRKLGGDRRSVLHCKVRQLRFCLLESRERRRICLRF